MTLELLGIGSALPPEAISQGEAAELAHRLRKPGSREARLLRPLYRRSGIERRHSVLLEVEAAGGASVPFYESCEDERGPGTRARMEVYEREIVPLAADAARTALERSGVDRERITHLVTVSCTGFGAPGIDSLLIEPLGLCPTVQRTHVGFMGCHGALNGLRVANAFAQSDADAHVLLAAAELCSLHFHPSGDSGRLVANAIFGDGAGALVGRRVRGAETERWCATDFGSCLFPDSRNDMMWQIGDHGFEMTLSSRVPDRIGEHLRPWIERWLAEGGRRLEEIASWAVHPGGPRVLSAVEASLGLSPDDTAVSREVLAERGNTSSPTVLRILERSIEQAAPLPCLSLAFGPGLAAEAALFDHPAP